MKTYNTLTNAPKGYYAEYEEEQGYETPVCQYVGPYENETEAEKAIAESGYPGVVVKND